jgi:hypothetical protein
MLMNVNHDQTNMMNLANFHKASYVSCSSVTPQFREDETEASTCAQDVQITRIVNNIVNRYNISINYKLKSLQNDPWVRKKDYNQAAAKI